MILGSRPLATLAGWAAITLAACATQPSTTGGAGAPSAAAPPSSPAAPTALAEAPSVAEAMIEVPKAAVEPTPSAPVTDVAMGALAREEKEAANARIVVDFYEMVFRDHRVDEAIRLYGNDTYIQHTPGAPDGWEALRDFLVRYFEANPLARSEIQRVVAQDDLVVLHVVAKDDPVDRGRAVVDIFRVEDGKIVEHWDVVQPIPAQASNANTMF